MAAALHPLVTPSDYILLEDGSYSLPETDKYLSLEGAICDDPHQGALEYNRALIRHLKHHAKNDYGEPRYQRIFRQYANNRRIKKVLAVASAIRDKHLYGKPEDCVEAEKQKTFTQVESVLFLHVPVEYLQIQA
ncbi:hypothetical protein MAQ5080_00757 [Marinomonas aquimarina]|uniref:Uncharacterized protein n=1 Tax=Marinomonas aquimarina TaxID=295068 RepID=A0A1A8T5E2_9GAMM|nr:hypothetical protein [Marinomonas aquimarina]SBS27252.1 hypothetical protein MAQ5080_00757 [Marinomonas aquimarina]